MGDHAVVPVEEYPVEVRMAVKRLKPRQRLFCEYLAGHADYVQAYMDAGYKTKDRDVASAAASRLLKNVRVTTYLNYLRMKKAARLAESQKLTTDYIINNLIETVERCRQVRPVIGIIL